MDDEKPPVRRFALKPKTVEPTDKVSHPGEGTAISVRLMHLENQRAAEKLPGLGGDGSLPPTPSGNAQPLSPVFAAKKFEPIDPPAQPGDEFAVDIQKMLDENAAARGSAQELIAMPPPRKSRRSRDFLAILGMAGLSAAVVVFFFRDNLPVAALALSCIAFITVILTWVLFGVMDKY